MALLIFSRKSGPIPCPLPKFNHVPIPDYNSLPQSSLEYPNSFNFLCKVALWNELGFSFKKSANFAFVEAEESVFIILVSLIKSLAVHFTCLMLFLVFSVLLVSQYFCKVLLQVLQGKIRIRNNQTHQRAFDYFWYVFSFFTEFYNQIFYGWWRAFTHTKQKKYRANYERLYHQWIGTCKMINMLRKGIKFSMLKVFFRKVIFNVDPIVNVLNALKNSNRQNFNYARYGFTHSRSIWYIRTIARKIS